MTGQTGAKERNIGIDLLRIFSMFLITILHVLGEGGVLDATLWMSKQYIMAWTMEIIAFCSVDCFALISGYVGIKSKFRWYKLVSLWIQVFFYSFIITALFFVFNRKCISNALLINALIPVTSELYWYVTAYFGVFLLMPVLNLGIENISEKAAKQFVTAAFAFFCVLPCIMYQAPYGLASGASMIWIVILYMLGGFLKKYEWLRSLSRKKAILIFAMSTLVVIIYKVTIELGTYRLLGHAMGGKTFIQYNSPMILLNAIMLLCIFSKIKVESNFIIKLIISFSAATFGVYLIHVHPLVFDNIINGFAYRATNYSITGLIGYVLVMSFIIYVVCSCIDIARLRVFKFFGVDKLLKRVDEKLN